MARIIVLNIPHHLTQRGNYRQIVFDTNNDRVQYLSWIKEYSERYGLKVWAYCLMDNHVHFIVMPSDTDSLAKTFNQAHMRYSQPKFMSSKNKFNCINWLQIAKFHFGTTNLISKCVTIYHSLGC